eukprot:TRINITY_DN11143_c0_g1_i1.p1 TRINITY_DN11143_c0_g1~~TRINITY_DN11143_c0_g1_i1.p1  ORF type:complete len:501 (+),score=92.70 TRINITY_DN11143_c0_g1_i1:84-1586(+)
MTRQLRAYDEETEDSMSSDSDMSPSERKVRRGNGLTFRCGALMVLGVAGVVGVAAFFKSQKGPSEDFLDAIPIANDDRHVEKKHEARKGPPVWVQLNGDNKVAVDQGSGLGPGIPEVTVEVCTKACHSHPSCGSFAFCQKGEAPEALGTCFLKTKELKVNDSTVPNDFCTSYFKTRKFDAWRPKVQSLLKPSTAPMQTFYMYRAVNDQTYPPSNLNLASLGGVMWYLHNEIVCHCPRRNEVTRILRYKVHTKTTQPLYDKGMNFGLRHAFDVGKCTGPAWLNGQPDTTVPCDGDSWDKYGYFVGCNDLNKNTFPFPTWRVHYPNATWYSMPGPCPSRFWDQKDEDCMAAEPGGICKGPPTGQGNCTISIEDAGHVRLDDIVGIPDKGDPLHLDWCASHQEYRFRGDVGDIDFWQGISDWDKNAERMAKIDRAFAKKYPAMPEDAALPQPKCDFSRHTFFPKTHPAYLPEANYTEVEAARWTYCHPELSPKKIAGFKEWKR